ncbi:DUF4974 domain-containing protein [Puteibacter caeruleilacunae]|nr:DUF4974 domain-containing protein [Puteibacter caeruleilacunae]
MGRIEKKHIDRIFNRKYSIADHRMLSEGFKQGDKLEDTRELVEQHWDEFEEPQEKNKETLNRVYNQINEIIGKEKHSRKLSLIHYLTKVAAILFIPLLIASLLLWNQRNEKNQEVATLNFEAPYGIRSQFTLPDGTKGWLNSGSTLKYTAGLPSQRSVELEGEAYFQVKRDEARPFYVQTDAFDIKVLGTKFNVNTFDGEVDGDLVLESGSVQIIDRTNKNKTLMVKPGQRITYEKKLGAYYRSSVDVDEYINWIEGKLVFQNEPLKEVVKRMERYYNVEFEIKDEALPSLKFRAVLEEELLEESLRYMSLVLPIEYKIIERQKNSDGTVSRRKVIITKN